MSIKGSTGKLDRPPRSLAANAGSWLLNIVLLVALGLAIAVVVVPMAFGGSSLTVLTGSMMPSINPGDMIAIRPVDPTDIHVGDVITFMPAADDPTLVTHRVMSKQFGMKTSWVTRGDANKADDHPITAKQIVGRFWYRVPYAGWLTTWVAGHRLGLGIALALSFAGYGLWRSVTRNKPSVKPSRVIVDSAGSDVPDPH